MFRLKNILKPFFYRYDCDGNESLDSHELSAVFVDLGKQCAVQYIMCHSYTIYFFAYFSAFLFPFCDSRFTSLSYSHSYSHSHYYFFYYSPCSHALSLFFFILFLILLSFIPLLPICWHTINYNNTIIHTFSSLFQVKNCPWKS